MNKLGDIEKKYYVVAGVCVAIIALVIVFFVVRTYSHSTTDANAAPAKSSLSVTFGDESLPHKMVVYVDPVCDHCAEYHAEALTKIYDNYVKTDKIALEVRPLAIVSEASAPLVGLMMCGNEQKKFWLTEAYIFAELNRDNGKNTAQNALAFFGDHTSEQIAKEVSMDGKKLATCLDANKYRNQIETANNEAYEAGINSTPITYIGDATPVKGASSYDFIKTLVDTTLDN